MRLSSALRLAALLVAVAALLPLLLIHAWPALADANATYPYPTPIAAMKKLPDGAPVFVSRKLITGVWLGFICIQEADRSAGIKAISGEHFLPAGVGKGNLISFTGTMGTTDGQRVVYATSDYDCYDSSAVAEIHALGVSSPGIMGWPISIKEPEGPRIGGLVPYGILIKIWGKVTATDWSDDDGYFFYIDDGWHKKDGSTVGATGIRVYSAIPPAINEFVAVTGVLDEKTSTSGQALGAETGLPVVRMRMNSQPYLFPGNLPTAASPDASGSASGLVRLSGQAAPGKTVRIYTEQGIVTVPNVTGQFQPFTISGISSGGTAVAASANGYISSGLVAQIGEADLVFDLQPSAEYVEIGCDKQSISVCSSDTAQVTAMLRDCEGKPIENRTVRLTTDRGFLGDGTSRQVLLTTDQAGRVATVLRAGTEGPGTAVITADTYPDLTCTAQASILLRAPEITVSASPRLLTTAGSSTISVVLTKAGVPVPSAVVTFRTDSGVFAASGSNTCNALTDGFGSAAAVLSVSAPGTAKVLVSYVDQCGNTCMNWSSVSYLSSALYGYGVVDSNPLTVDLDGSGQKRIVVGLNDGRLVAITHQGTVLWSALDQSSRRNTPSAMVMDQGTSARPYIFMPCESQQRVFAYSADGLPVAGWPAGACYRFLSVAAPLADMNRDGTPEIVAGDESCYVYCWNPTGDWKDNGNSDSSYLWRNLTGSPSTTIFYTTCAVGTLEPDPDAMLATICGSDGTLPMFGFPGAVWGDFITDPLYLPDYPRLAGDRLASSPAIGDIDGDGCNDFAIGCDDGKVYAWLSSSNAWTSWTLGGVIRSSPALCDLDSDGRLDIVIGSFNGRVYAINWQGKALAGWEGGIQLSNTSDPVLSSPVIGDVTGDGVVDIVVGCDDGCVYALYKDGVNHRQNGVLTGPVAWIRCCVPPGRTTAQIHTAPVLDDVDNNGMLDVVVGGSEGLFVFPFQIPYSYSPARYPWPTFHHDNERTGCATALPAPVNASIRGRVTSAGQPVCGAKVYIYYNDGSPVPTPANDGTTRGYVLTVGSPSATQAGKGAYCISQLLPNRAYRLVIEATGHTTKTIPDVQLTTGVLWLNVAL